MRELNKTNSDLRFYHSKFPMCDGVAYEHWTYEYHRSFELDADYMAEYVLHINDGQVKSYSDPLIKLTMCRCLVHPLGCLQL